MSGLDRDMEIRPPEISPSDWKALLGRAFDCTHIRAAVDMMRMDNHSRVTPAEALAKVALALSEDRQRLAEKLIDADALRPLVLYIAPVPT